MATRNEVSAVCSEMGCMHQQLFTAIRKLQNQLEELEKTMQLREDMIHRLRTELNKK